MKAAVSDVTLTDRVAYDRGVHLRGTSLWLDAERRRELALITCVGGKLPPLHKRAVTTPELAALLERAGWRGAVLPAPAGRWVGVGGLELQFLALDAGAPAAAVLAALGADRILYTGPLRRLPVDWPEARLVVAQLPALSHRGGNFDQAVTALGMFVAQAAADGRAASVLVDAVEPGLAVLFALRQAGHEIAPTGYLARLCGEPVRRRARCELALASSAPAARDGRTARVDTGLGPAFTSDATVRLRWWADPLAVAELVRRVGASAVCTIGAPPRELDALAGVLGPGVRVCGLGGAQQLELVK